MNVEASTPAQSITQIASPEQLVAAREARGWSMSDVAAKLGMMPRQIDAIENGRWDALPGAAFVRGAIRAYGKALQLDVAPLLSALGAQSGTPELRPSSSLDSPLPRHGALGFDNGGSGSRIVWIVLGVIGVIAIAMYFGRGADFGQVLEPGSSGSGPGRAVDVVPVAPGASSTGGAGDTAGASGAPAASGSLAASAAGSGPAGASVAPAAAGPTGAPVGSGAAGLSASSGASGAHPATAATAAPTTPATQPASPSAAGSAAVAGSAGTSAGATAPSAAVGSDTTTTASAANASAAGAAPASEPAKDAASAVAADSVVLRFERESWVDVRDASGKVLLMGTQPANSTREVSGQKPYSMTIGNATFVRVEHGGRNVDLGAVTQKGVARVRVE